MSLVVSPTGFAKNLTDFIVKYINGKPEDINNWQKQGVLSTLADDSKRQELLLELCEIYFSFVMTRLRIGEDFKKEGKLALPIDRQGFMDPKHNAIYKPDVASFSITAGKCS